jgi:single-stranded-DNA-specific exonuclease
MDWRGARGCGLLIMDAMPPFAPKRWVFFDPAPTEFINCQPEHPLLLQVLHNRGLRTAAEVTAFLQRVDAVKENPYRLRDMSEAVTRIVRAIELGETICVYGDFDADGVSATALLVNALQAAGGRVGPYIPDRVDEGYGLNLDAIERIATQAKLMITVDCGIRSVAEVQQAVALGLAVIVTDHHSVGPELPPALAVINPRRKDCPSRFERLAGVGVAYRLAQAVLRAVAHQKWSRLTPDQAAEIEQSLLDLVALGTVADMMPLLGENRTLVAHGLAQLNQTPRPGLATLLQHADLRPGTVDATAISFRLAPRINAAGRLSHAKRAYQLLRTRDPVEAFMLAQELESLNQERQRLSEAAQSVAEAQLAGQLADNPPLYVVSSPAFKAGIVGLVAGKLSERFYRPVVVVEEGEEESRGSARSIPELDISRALDEVGHLLVRHGGHKRAAGFTVATARLPEFTAALYEVAARTLADATELRPTLQIDAKVAIESLNWGLQEQFARLEPTGHENPPPLLLSQRLRVREARTVGAGRHLRLVVDGGPQTPVLDAVAFNRGEWRDQLGQETQIDLVYHLEANEWQGRRRLQLNVQDMRLAEF